MNFQEYELVKNYTYEQYVKYLLEKYGVVEEDYYTSSFNTIKNKRFEQEYLERHHIKEDEIAGLSDYEIAKNSPFEYQLAKNLVYCNLFEHIFLHILIGEQNKGLGFGGAQIMIAKANDINWQDEECEILEILKVRCNNSLSAYEILLEHNMTLFYDLDETLQTSDRALVVLGTGLGKTTTGLAYLRKYGYKAIVLCPNNTIVQGWQDNPEVTAITYQKFMNSYKQEDYSKYQVLICDEAHHCTAARWGEGIRYVLDNGLLKVVGLTATPKEKKDKKNFETTAEFFNQKVCKGYTVLEGIENEKIHDFSYVGAIYDTSDIKEKYKNINDKTLLGELDLELNNTPTMEQVFLNHMPTSKRKGIIFVSNIEAMDEAESIMKNLYPDLEYRRLHSLLPGLEIEETRNWFQNTNEGYLLAVNMISEGAHYKGVNTIIMFRRTQSSLVFNQQLGRIITLKKDEDPEAIVFDLVNNANLIEEEGDRFSTSLKRAYQTRKERGGKEKSKQIIIADYGKKISEILRKIKENVFHTRNILQINPETLQIIKKFNSIAQALREVSEADHSGIIRCCQFKQSKSGGYCWVYENNWSPQWQPYQGAFVRERAVWCLETQTEYISSAEAGRQLGILSGEIRDCCNGKGISAKGKHFCWADEKYTFTIRKNKCKKPVYCYETKMIYESAAEAGRQLNINYKNISRVCCGERQSTAGFHFCFAENIKKEEIK